MASRALRTSAIVSLIAAFLAASAADAQTVRKTTVAGGVLRLGHFASVNPDCTSRGETVVRVTKLPAHGTVQTKRDKAFSTVRNYKKCNLRRVDGVTVEYLPQPGYLGRDTVTFGVTYPSAKERMRTYNIAVK